MIGIYGIKNSVNGKFYIGLSSNIEHRFLFHKRRLLSNTHKNTHLQSAFNKYRLENFEFLVLLVCAKEQLVLKEKEYIKIYQSYKSKFGYNKTLGGEFGQVSEEANERRRQKLKLQKVSVEMRKRISKTLTGRKTPKDIVLKRAAACRKVSDELEQQIVQLFRDKNMTKDTIAQLLSLNKTTIVSVLRRHKISKYKWKKTLN